MVSVKIVKKMSIIDMCKKDTKRFELNFHVLIRVFFKKYLTFKFLANNSAHERIKIYYRRKKRELTATLRKPACNESRWRDGGGRARAHRVIEFFFPS